MAIYNPTAPTQMPQYLRYSQEPNRERPNLAVGGLLHDIGDLFGQTVQGVDTIIKQKIENEAHDKLQANQEQEITRLSSELAGGTVTSGGVAPSTEGLTQPPPPTLPSVDTSSWFYNPSANTAAPAPSNAFGNPPDITGTTPTDISSQNVPPEVQEGVKGPVTQLNTNKQLRAAGKMDDAEYELRATAIAKDLYTRYPGYRSYIDQVTGNPANAAIARLRSARDAMIAAQQNTQDAWTKEVVRDREYFETPAAFEKALNTTDPVQQNRIRVEIATKQQKEHAITVHRSEIADKAASREFEGNTYVGTANSIADDMMSSVLSGKRLAITNMGEVTIDQAFDRISKDTIKDPVQMSSFMGALDRTLTEFDDKWDKEINTRRYLDFQGNTKSLAELVGDRGKLDKIRDSAKARLVEMRKSIGGGDYNGFKSSGMILEATRKSDQLRVYAALPQLRVWDAAVAGMPQAAQLILSEIKANNATLFGQTLGGLVQLSLPGLAIGGTSLLETRKKAEEIVNTEGSSQDRVTQFDKQQISNMKKLLDPATSTPELRAGVAKTFANADNGAFVRVYTVNQRPDVWNDLSSPEVIKQMQQSGTETSRKFFDWNNKMFFQLTHDFARKIQQDGIEYDTRLNIRYNPETRRIEYDKTPQMQAQETARAAGVSAPYSANATVDYINKLNIMLGVRENLLNAYGIDPKGQIPKDLAAMGVDFGARPGTLGEAIGKAYNSAKDYISDKLQREPPSRLFQKKSEGGSQSIQVGAGEASTFQASYRPGGAENASRAILERIGGVPANDLSNRLAYAEEQQPRKLQINGNVDLRHVEPTTKGVIQDAVKEGLPIHLISGYRSPDYNRAVGGARGSQHMHGKAFDVDLKHMSEDEKQAVVSHFLSDPRVGGFGYYPGSDTIHVDTRDSKAAWGSNRSSSSIGKGWPAWLTRQVKGWLQSSTEGTPSQTKLAEVLPPSKEIPNDWQELFQHENGRATSGRFKGMTAEEIQQKLGPAYDVFTQPKGFMGIRNRPAPKGPLVAMNTEGFGQSDNIEDVRRPVETPQTLLEREQLMQPTPEKVRGQRQLEEGPPPPEVRRKRNPIPTLPERELPPELKDMLEQYKEQDRRNPPVKNPMAPIRKKKSSKIV